MNEPRLRFLVIQEQMCLGCDGHGWLRSRTQGARLQVSCSACGGTGWTCRKEVAIEEALRNIYGPESEHEEGAGE
jgi:hypothetical protein